MSEHTHCLLHLSDLHFGTERPEVQQALLDWVRAHRPESWVLTGDITQRATAAQFAGARAFREAMAALAVPLAGVLPGNHDIPLFNLWARFSAPYRRYARAFDLPERVPEVAVRDWPHLRLLMVKTTRRWRHERGELSMAQIRTVARHLREAEPAQLRVVAVHQPLALRTAEAGGGMQAGDRLIGAEPAISAWREAGGALVLGGHAHLPYAMRLPGVQALWVLQAGTAISSRTRAGVPNAFATIHWRNGGPEQGPRCVVWRLWHWQSPQGFVLVQQVPLNLT